MSSPARYQFRTDRLPASRRPVVVTDRDDAGGVELAGDREVLLALRDDVSSETARRLAALLNDAVENVSLLSA